METYTKTITIKNNKKEIVKSYGKITNLDMAVYSACPFASKKEIDNIRGIAEITFIFENENEIIEDCVSILDIEEWNCEVVEVN